jgi:hypothetical protein
MNALPNNAPDPVVNQVHVCPQCSSPMGRLRVHEGSNNPERRGTICQTVCPPLMFVKFNY